MKGFLTVFHIFYAAVFFFCSADASSESHAPLEQGVKKITDNLYVGKAKIKRKDGSTDHVWIGLERIDTRGEHTYQPHPIFRSDQVLHYNDPKMQQRYEFWEEFVHANAGNVSKRGDAPSINETAAKYKETLKQYYYHRWPKEDWQKRYPKLRQTEDNVANEVLSYELAKENNIDREDKMPVELQLPEGAIHMSFDRGVPNSLGTGFNSFKMMLQFNTDNELWVAFVSTIPINKTEDIKQDTIEMVVTVTTSPDAPMTHHMGINRSILYMQKILDSKAIGHSNLAIPLHAFAARVMKIRYPDKVYMITSPVESMYHVLQKHAPHTIKWDARKKESDDSPSLYEEERYSLAKRSPDHPKVQERDQKKCELRVLELRKSHLLAVRESLWDNRDVLEQTKYISLTTTELGKLREEIWDIKDHEEKLQTEFDTIDRKVRNCLTYVIKSPDGTKDIFIYKSEDGVVKIGDKIFTGDQLDQFGFFHNIHNTLSSRGIAIDLGELAKAVELVD